MAINIVALGGSRAGKSLYLASLYNKLQFQSNDNNAFYLKIEADIENNKKQVDAVKQAQKLNEICADVINMDRKDYFSDGTRGFDSWLFQFKVRNAFGNHNAGSFKYVDYAGGIINEALDGQEVNLESLIKSIQEANIILVFLDGIKLIELLKNNDSMQPPSEGLTRWVNMDINNILGYIQKAETSIPIHFVITKWDCLIESKLDNLQNITKILLKEIPRIADIVNADWQKSSIRLIPVSSVGEGFARTEYKEDGTFSKITKIGNKLALDPYLVEVPLAYALIDSLTDQLNKEQKKVKGMNLIKRTVKLIIDSLDIADVNLADFLPLPYNILGKGAIKIIEKSVNNTNGNLMTFENITTATVQNEKQSIQNVANSCIRSIKLFQDNFPGSLLNRG